jgi:hypothetical protein
MLHYFSERWKVAAHTFGNFQARLLLNIFYFLVLTPFALGVKMFSDPLRIRRQHPSQWLPAEKKTIASSEPEGVRKPDFL